MRLGGAIGLQWQDLDSAAREIHVAKAVSRGTTLPRDRCTVFGNASANSSSCGGSVKLALPF